MACPRLQAEFRLRKLTFTCAPTEAESFHVSQWSKRRNLFLCYRLMMALISLSGTMAYYLYCKHHCTNAYKYSYQYMTIWADFLRTNYFVWALILSAVKMKIAVNVTGTVLKWFTASVWFLHSIAMSSNACVALLYWPFVMPYMEHKLATNVMNIYMHSVNYLLLLIDLAIVAFPIRILHAVYSSLLGISYGVFTYILWKAGGNHAVYPFLNWKNNPAVATGFVAALAVIAAPIMQVVTFFMYLLRKWCFCKCGRAEENCEDNPETHSLKDSSELLTMRQHNI